MNNWTDAQIEAARQVVRAAGRLREDEEWVPIAMLARYSALKAALDAFENALFAAHTAQETTEGK